MSIGSNKKAPNWVRLRLVKVESAAREARKLLKCFGNTSTRKGASWSNGGHRITVIFVFNQGNGIKRCSRVLASSTKYLKYLLTTLASWHCNRSVGTGSRGINWFRSCSQASNVLSAQALFFFVFVGTTPFAASLTSFSETGVANTLAFNVDSSLVHSVFGLLEEESYLLRKSVVFFLFP